MSNDQRSCTFDSCPHFPHIRATIPRRRLMHNMHYYNHYYYYCYCYCYCYYYYIAL